MANVIGELVWKITGDNSGINRKAKETESTMTRMAKVVGTAIAGIGFLQITKQLVRLASDAEETANKFGVVFSSIADEANAAANNLVDNFGLSSQAAKSLLSDTGDLLTGFGFTQEAALDLSSQVNTLAVDLASFTNFSGGAEGASAALTKALLGERESLKSLGIAISEADLKEFIESQGQSFEATTRQEKAQATLALAIRQSGNAIGDFARSSDSYANVVRRVQARFQDIGAELGQNLLPALSNLGLAFLESSKDGGVLIKLFNQITEVIGNVINAFAILTSTLNQKSLQSDFDEALEKGQKYLELTKQVRAEIINRFGSIEEATRLAEQENEQGREALRLLNLYEKGQQVVKNSSAEINDLNSKLRGNLGVMEGIQNRIAGVEGEINNRLENRVNITNEVKKISGEVNKEEERAVLITDNWVAALASVITQWDKLQGAVARVQAVNSAVQASGNAIINILTSVAQLQQAITNNRIEALDAQMEAELEAAGVSEETTLEQAQREYDIAVATGSELEKEEKRRALEKAKIEERFARRRATLQYEGELQAWEMQKTLAIAQGALAAINAYSSAAAVPIIGFTIAPFAAAAALTASAIQYQAIVASKPQPPKFAEGGIVPGTSFTGDNVTARLNSGEMVLNQTQQSRLFEIANGAGSMGNITIYLGDEQIYKSLYNASKRGDLIIDARGVVTR